MSQWADSVEEHDRNIHRIKNDLAHRESAEFLLISDVHFDSKKCDRELLKKHFNKAQDRDAGIIIAGDWFDVMGCQKDPRSMKNDIRSQYIVEGMSYLDCVVRDSYDFLGEYRNNIFLIGYGNHETKIKKHNETDPLGNLVFMLNERGGDRVYHGGYSGVVVFQFTYHDGKHQSKVLQYHHGDGGGAYRSKGMLDVDIDAAKWPDADIVAKGHDHNKWQTVKMRKSFNTNSMKLYESAQHHLRLGSYKKKGDGYEGWSTEKGHEPKRRGGWWVEFEMNSGEITVNITEAS